jgi:hypothetical protein
MNLSKDKAKFVSVVAGLAELYNRSLTDASIELWWLACKKMSIESFEAAVARHMHDPQRGRFMPTPADLVHQIARRRPTAISAWAEVLDAMEAHGAYQSVVFQDGVINAVIRDLGGWPALCRRQGTDANPVWIRKEFEGRYEDYLLSGRFLRVRLPGLIELHNHNAGYSSPESRYIKSLQAIEARALIPPPAVGERRFNGDRKSLTSLTSLIRGGSSGT